MARTKVERKKPHVNIGTIGHITPSHLPTLPMLVPSQVAAKRLKGCQGYRVASSQNSFPGSTDDIGYHALTSEQLLKAAYILNFKRTHLFRAKQGVLLSAPDKKLEVLERKKKNFFSVQSSQADYKNEWESELIFLFDSIISK